jgi:hypothetical protein
MKYRILMVSSLLGLAALGTRTAVAQDSRLAARFPSAVAQRIGALVDSVALEGLPTEPVVLRALEGAAKAVPPDRILLVLDRLRGSLRVARAVLGSGADATELTTAATALQAGIPEEQLVELHGMRGKHSLTAPLGAYLDLIQRGGPRDKAWNRVRDLIQRGASDADFVHLTPADLDTKLPSRPVVTRPGGGHQDIP